MVRGKRMSWAGRIVVLTLSVLAVFLGAGRASAVHQNGLFELEGDAFNDPALPGDDWSSVNLGLPGGYFSRVFVPYSVEGPGVDTTFFHGGGSKDTNDLSQWGWSANDVAPDKDQLTDTYAASYVDSSGHTIVNFGADRFDTSGDANVGFWFFQSPVSLNANGSFSGQHSDGDVFVVSAFTNGGSAPMIDVYKWQSGSLVKLTGGQTCTPGDTACAYVNSGPIPVSWFYADKAGDPAGTVPTSAFFEGGIDLNSLFSGGKIPCFSNFLAETRSSQAPNAQLKDLAVGSVDSCGTITIHKSATPKSPQSFGFAASGADPKVSSFSLVDNGDSATSTKKFESISAGAYSVSENQPPADWDFDHISCSTTGNGTTATPSGRSLSINLAAGGSADCTYYNVRKPSLTVTKSVVPVSDSGAFGLQIDGQTKATGGNGTTTGAVLVGVGAHSISEVAANGTVLANYTAVYGGDCDASGHVALAAGDAKACTITNTRIPTLTVQKVLQPAADAGTFGLQIDGQTKATGGNGATTGAVLSTIGTHSVGEVGAAGTDPSHYESSIGGDCAANGSVTLAPGDNKVCVITNRRKPTLTVTKVLVPANDSGTFGLQIDGQTKATGGNGTTTGKVELSSGAHTVAEVAAGGTDLANYVSSIGGDCLADGSVSLAAGENKACTITNTRKARLFVIKKVINDNGGTAAPADFTLSVNATDPTPASFKGADTPGVEVTLAPGAYSVAETGGPAGYTGSFSAACTGTIALGETKTCTVTNNDQPAKLIVKKVVINDDGGTKTAADFSFQVNNGNATAFEADGQNDLTVNAGNYTVTEPAAAGYTTTYDNCNNVALANGGTATCTITNNDQPAKLIVKKVVINDNGGTKTAADFSFQVNNGNATAFEADGQNDLTVNAGNYTVTEPAAAGYTTTYDNCNNVAVAGGGTATCTITNDDQPAKLIVKKIVINDNGGTAVASDFSFQVNGGNATSFEADGQNDLTVNAGNYTVIEKAAAGYTTSYDNCDNVALGNGATATCTITNNDQPAKLIVIKQVVNDNGGKAVSSDFTLAVDATNPTPASFKGADAPGVEVSLAPGAYSVSETGGPDGYAGSFSAGCSGTIALGQTRTCTVTNDDQPAKLIVKKIVINDDGGTKTAADFSFTVNGGAASSFEADGQNDLTVDAGSYSVTEPAASGYTTSYDNCDNLALANGETKTCTITNNDQPAKLIVKKIVINDNGGTKTAADFSFKVNNGNATAFDADGQNDLTVNAGSYSITEPAAGGYTTSYDNCSELVLANGATATCTITNDDQPAKLVVRKIVINDNGGTKTAADFSFTVNGGNATAFEADGQNDLTVNAGNYSVTEPAAGGYTTTYDNCSELTLANGATATCTITNNDQPAKLIVKKIVINDNGGTKTAGDFTLAVSADSATPASFAGSSNGVTVDLHPGGYSVSETGTAAGYAASLSADCVGTIALGETKTCVVTNDDIAGPPPPPLPPTPPVTPVPPAPQIDLAITKRDRPDPATVGERITYTLTVRNNGPDTATGVVVADPLPGSVSFASVKTTQGTCTGGILVRCELGTMKSGSVVVITITVTPRQTGIVFNRATVVGNEAETTTANNTASTTTLVKGAFIPAAVVQHGCIAISVGTRSTTVGVHSRLTIHATELGKPAKGVKVRVHGAGVDRLSPRSDGHGSIRLTIVPRKAGIIRITVASRDACGTARIGVVGAFTPPVTG